MNNPVIDGDGTKNWYNELGERHREDGPAVEWVNGDKYWMQHNDFHREDGPAVENASGSNYWYYRDQPIEVSCQKEFESYLKLKAFW